MAVDDPRAAHVAVRRGFLIVDLFDGRRLSVPLTWFPRLLRASKSQRDELSTRAGEFAGRRSTRT